MSGCQDFSRQLLQPGADAPTGLLVWNGADPQRRFNIYRNNVLVSLLDALTDSFPVVAQLVGADFFRAMAREFVLHWPPQSPVMLDYGAGFAAFVESFPPAASLPYLADVARLERLRIETYHAADASATDGAVALAAAMAEPDRLAALRLRLHPACRCLSSAHPVFSIWAAHQGQGELQQVDMARAEDVLVFRPAHEVLVLALAPGGADFVRALAEGRRLGAAAADASAIAGFDLAETLRILIGNGLLLDPADA